MCKRTCNKYILALTYSLSRFLVAGHSSLGYVDSSRSSSALIVIVFLAQDVFTFSPAVYLQSQLPRSFDYVHVGIALWPPGGLESPTKRLIPLQISTPKAQTRLITQSAPSSTQHVSAPRECICATKSACCDLSAGKLHRGAGACGYARPSRDPACRDVAHRRLRGLWQVTRTCGGRARKLTVSAHCMSAAEETFLGCPWTNNARIQACFSSATLGSTCGEFRI